MKDIKQFNEKGNRHGYWEIYWPNGNLMLKGHYNNGTRHGYWEVYYHNGGLWYKGNYDNNDKIGLWEIYDNDELVIQIFYS
jgi:antitoxin component YwqK of YwqJK toxin-antitoxin module